MATSSDDMKNDFTYRRYQDGDDKHGPWNQEIFQASWTHKCPTYVHRTPPCQGSCPSGDDIRGWLDIVRGIEKPAGEMTHAGVRLPPLHRRQPLPFDHGSRLPRSL